jgi:hypothetical protein
VVHDTYLIGGRHIGVRWSSPELAPVLREALGSLHLDVPSPANVSVVMGERDGPARGKHHLYVAGRHVVSSASDGRVLVALVRALDDLVVQTTSPYLRLRATVLVQHDAPEVAVVVDDRLLAHLDRAATELRRAGYALADLPAVYIDELTHQVVVAEPTLPLATPLDQLARLGTPDRAAAAPPARMHIGRVVVASSPGGASSAMRTVPSQTSPVMEGVGMVLRASDGRVDPQLARRAVALLASCTTVSIDSLFGDLPAALVGP